MRNPKVSVIMAVFNTEKYLKESIESILNQDYKDFEFIIINDGSTDESSSIIESYARLDGRIIFLQNEANSGISKTRNKGLKSAKGEYIANFDSDDVAENNWLETQIGFLENNKEISVCGSNINFINRESKHVQKLKYPKLDNDIKASLYYVNPFVHSSVVIRRTCFTETGFYDENIKNAEDLDLWFRFSNKGYILHNTQEYLINYRIHGTNSIILQRKEMVKNTFKLLKSNKIFSKIKLNRNALKFFVVSFIKYSYVIFLVGLKK